MSTMVPGHRWKRQRTNGWWPGRPGHHPSSRTACLATISYRDWPHRGFTHSRPWICPFKASGFVTLICSFKAPELASPRPLGLTPKLFPQKFSPPCPGQGARPGPPPACYGTEQKLAWPVRGGVPLLLHLALKSLEICFPLFICAFFSFGSALSKSTHH